MAFEKKAISLLIICMLVFSVLTILIPQRRLVTAQPAGSAEFTGNLFDVGRDKDGDGKYDLLEVAFEINVSTAGNYQIEVDYLREGEFSNFGVWSYRYGYLNAGAQLFNVSYFASQIYVGRHNVTGVAGVWLRDQYSNTIDNLPIAAFSRTYNFTEFDIRAALTGHIYDEGIDTDGNGLFDKLEVIVEVNVTDAATYTVNLSNLYGNVSVTAYESHQSFLGAGIQTLNLSVNGLLLRLSRGYVSTISRISLDVVEEDGYSYYSIQLQSINGVMLNRSYNYDEFDQAAFFTGRVLDEGIDEDSDGLFDYLEIGVEVNVTDAGFYSVEMQNLVGTKIPGNYSEYLYVNEGFGGDFAVGLHLINFNVYGPEIYGAQIDPTYVERLSLRCRVDPWGSMITVEERYFTPLSILYNCSQFESHAILTGAIFEEGVDPDGDGLYDNLNVGVQVNVTEAGTYELSGSLSPVGYYLYVTEDLEFGVHFLDLTFPGPMIACYHANPAKLVDIRLTETSTGTQLGYISEINLSRTYYHTEFNTPMNDMQIELTIYPNATIGISGALNYTRMYPQYQFDYSPSANATISFSTGENATTGSANGTVKLPRYAQQQWPYSSSTADFAYKYENDILEAELNATIPVPPPQRLWSAPAEGTPYPLNSSDFSLSATYSDQTLNLRFQGLTALPSAAYTVPFNISDVTVLANYRDGEMVGNITFHAISGFPLGDVTADFKGNKTDVSLTGYVNLIYGTYFGTSFNETSVENMLAQINSTIPGRGAQSLYAGTGGSVECTRLNTTKTPIASPFEGARIDFNATIEGNFTNLLAQYVTSMLFGYYATNDTRSLVYAGVESTLDAVNDASITLNYYCGSKIGSVDLVLNGDAKTLWTKALELVPPTIPPESRNTAEAWLDIANVTAYAVQDASISVEYSKTLQRFDLNASLTANVTQIKNATLALLPEALPPTVPVEFKDLIASCMNTTYCKLDSSNATVHYLDGKAHFNVAWLVKGDLATQLNHLKSCYIKYLKLTAPGSFNWQTGTLNSTWIDVGNLKAELRQGKDWETLVFSGIKVSMTKDEVDFVQFKLQKLFNLTSGYSEPPREFEKLRIILTAGFNGTHTVLLCTPGTVPSPNTMGLDYKTAKWNNVTMSSMKDLIFRIAFQGTVLYLGDTFYVPIFSNSTINHFGFDPFAKRISFNVTGTESSGFFNITIPRALLYATPSQWVLSVDGVQQPLGLFNVTENADYVFIYLPYSHSEHEIAVQGTWIVTEFPPSLLLVALTTLSLATAALAISRRRKLGTLVTTYQRMLRAFAGRLHQSRT